jgi:hypothetical protein
MNQDLETYMMTWLELDDNMKKQKLQLREQNQQKKHLEEKILLLMEENKKEEIYVKSSGENIKVSKSNKVIKKKKNMTTIKGILNEMLSQDQYSKINTVIDTPQSIEEKSILKLQKVKN